MEQPKNIAEARKYIKWLEKDLKAYSKIKFTIQSEKHKYLYQQYLILETLKSVVGE